MKSQAKGELFAGARMCPKDQPQRVQGAAADASHTAALRHVRHTGIEICILAGGLSSRMGRDKSKLRVGGQTLLGRIRRTARTLKLPMRVIRRDLVPRCGPLGGVYTALKTTSAEAVLFLACDMPQVSEPLLRKLLERASGAKAIFTWSNGAAGFPFLLNRSALPLVETLMNEKRFSLQALARETRAKHFRAGRGLSADLLNLNTPGDWSELKKAFGKKGLNLREGRLVN